MCSQSDNQNQNYLCLSDNTQMQSSSAPIYSPKLAYMWPFAMGKKWKTTFNKIQLQNVNKAAVIKGKLGLLQGWCTHESMNL